MNVNHAILHAFDFESGGSVYSQRELDLGVRPVKSFVQRHVRKAFNSAENKHGEFAADSQFAQALTQYFEQDAGFVALSVQIAEFLYDQLRMADPVEPTDLLVVDYEDDTDAQAAVASEEAEVADAAFEGRGERRFALLLLPRKQSFMHDISEFGGAPFADVVRHDATLPSPTQKLDTYAIVSERTMGVDFNDKQRTIAGTDTYVIPDGLLQCAVQQASTREVLDTVTRIVEDVAQEYGANTAVALSKAKNYLVENVDESEELLPWDLADEVFEDVPAARERFAEEARREELPERVSVKRSATARMAKSHRIRTDTGIEITFPSEYSTNTDYIQFFNEPDGRISIELKNIGSIENR